MSKIYIIYLYMYINAYVRTAMIASLFLLALPLASHLFNRFQVDFCAWFNLILRCLKSSTASTASTASHLDAILPSHLDQVHVKCSETSCGTKNLQVLLRKIALGKCVTQFWVANVSIPGCTGQLRHSLDSSCSPCPTSRNRGCSCRTLFPWTPTTATFLFRVLEISCRRISHVGIGFTGLGKYTNT